MNNHRTYLKLCLIVIGVLLFVLNLYGLFVKPLENDIYTQNISGYDYRTISVQDAMKQGAELKKINSDNSKAIELFYLISQSYIHLTRPYEIQPYDNWILWLGGYLYKPLRDSQDPNLLWKRGGGFCHQAAIIYVAKGKSIGLRTRLVGLNGHVVAEVKTSNGWRVVDPDLGVFWDYSLDDFRNKVTAVEIFNKIAEAGYSNEFVQHWTKIYNSTDDNFLTSYPNARKRYYLEKVSIVLKWIIPIISVIIGIFFVHPVSVINARRESLDI